MSRIECCDAFELLSSIPDGSINLVLTDPPYGETVCDWDSGNLDYKLMMDEFMRVLVDGGNCLVMGTNPFASRLIVSNSGSFKYDLVWDKVIPNGAWYARHRPMGRHELICVFGKGRGRCYYEPLMELRESPLRKNPEKRTSSANVVNGFTPLFREEYTHRHPTSIISVMKKKGIKAIHPCAKPVELMERLVRMYCPVGGVVLDPFCGSGSVGLACKRTGREFILCDLRKEYVEYSRAMINAES